MIVVASILPLQYTEKMKLIKNDNNIARPVILASGSPRRLSIMQEHGVEPIVRPSNSDEALPEGADEMTMEEKVMYIAAQKARDVYEEWLAEREGHATGAKGGAAPATETHADFPLILAADTVVYKDRIIGKPKDEADAVAILTELRNTFHFVYSGICIIDTKDGAETSLFDVTKVWFKDYPDEEICRYVGEEQPYDKSGSYGIQSSWGQNVERVEGDVENVMGLPWRIVAPVLSAPGQQDYT